MNKTETLEQIQTSRAALDAALAQVPPAEMSSRLVQADWSVQDLIAHLAYWEGFVLDLAEVLRAGQTPDPILDLDGLNAQILAQGRQATLENLLSQEQALYARILALVAAATDEELFNSEHFPAAGRAFVGFLLDNTAGHYTEHLPDLTACLPRKHVKVLFFATLRDKAGARSTELDLPAGTTIGGLKELLVAQFPNLDGQLMEHCLASINHEYQFDEVEIPDQAEIALFPPVSGG
jgi:molybdopterin converting factor subunit 1